MFLMADLRLDGQDETHRVKVRNLSNGGMMAEAHLRVAPGASVQVSLRNIGWVDGTVAWVQDTRFGIAFCSEVDARLTRLRTSQTDVDIPRHARPLPLNAAGTGNPPIRKI